MRWRKQVREPNSPNFLFSTWPWLEWGTTPRIVMEPSGEDDTTRMQAASDRLSAIGGGVVRLSAGDYFIHDPIYIYENHLDGQGGATIHG